MIDIEIGNSVFLRNFPEKRSFIWTNIEFFNPKNNLAKNIFILSTLR